jgi:DNA-binding transcriptional regulator YdaS (Cro superfamily)
MKFTDYVESIPRERRRTLYDSICSGLKVAHSTVRAWKNGARKMKPSHLLWMENFTHGVVSRYDERPDIYPRD